MRPAPFFLGLAFAGLGLGLSTIAVRETRPHADLEAFQRTGQDERRPLREVIAITTWRDQSRSAGSQAGLVNNLNEGMTWGLFPVFFSAGGLTVTRVGLLTALAPAVWAVGQLLPGALSDRLGRKWLIAAGQGTQALGLLVIATGNTTTVWMTGSILFGAGTALAYPTLLAAVGDRGTPELARRRGRCLPILAGRRGHRRRGARRHAGRTCGAWSPPSSWSPPSPPRAVSTSRCK
ncbi:MAG: MFS transporter [Actinomycetota bacterium]|nr:MFS transporter [Actinomycetota bacterium]